MAPKNWRYFSSLAKLCILAGLVGTISSGCTSVDTASEQASSEAKSSPDSIPPSQNAIKNIQKVDLKGNNVRVISRTSSTTEGVNTRSESIKKNTEVARIDAPSPKIASGRYWVGGTDQALEVAGDRYRYDTEGGEQPWQHISNLKYVKDDVVFDGKTYWCLSTIAPNPITGCGANGWSR